MTIWDFLRYYIDQLGGNLTLSGITISLVAVFIALLGYTVYLYVPHFLRENSKNLETSRNVHKEINSFSIIDDENMIKVRKVVNRVEKITLFYEIEYKDIDKVFNAKEIFLTPGDENILLNNTKNNIKSFDIQYKKPFKRKYIQFRYLLIKKNEYKNTDFV